MDMQPPHYYLDSASGSAATVDEIIDFGWGILLFDTIDAATKYCVEQNESGWCEHHVILYSIRGKVLFSDDGLHAIG